VAKKKKKATKKRAKKPQGCQPCHWANINRPRASEDEVVRARKLYQTDDVEIDTDTRTSVGDDGKWIQAWVWLPKEDA
jgi:hypothetical protein